MSPFAGIESISSPHDKYFAYYDVGSEASMQTAQRDLASYVAAEGPFDGVLAFSQGSALVARFLQGQGQGQGSQLHGHHRASPLPPFKCAIFLSGHPPDHDTTDGSASIMIPTVHIWGTNDELDPKQPEKLSNLCKSDCRSVFVHEGGHEVPNSRHADALTHAVRVIRRALAAISV